MATNHSRRNHIRRTALGPRLGDSWGNTDSESRTSGLFFLFTYQALYVMSCASTLSMGPKYLILYILYIFYLKLYLVLFVPR